MIEEGNLIAYEYFSHRIFDFKVYDHTDCLAKGVGGHLSNKPDEQDITTDVVSHLQAEQVMGGEDHCCSTAEEENQETYFFEVEEVTDGKVVYLIQLVPNEVIKVYNLQLPESVLLIDPEERQFCATRKIWSEGRIHFVGWKTLCVKNLVEDEHIIICEFVHIAGEFCIRVSFFLPPEEQQSLER